MGSLFKGISHFFVNKTTVTIIGVVAGLAVLVGFYLYRVNTDVNPVKVPVAKRDISATEKITDEDIEYVNVSSSYLSSDTTSVYLKSEVDSLVGKYVTTGTTIPKGSMFYKAQVVEKKELPNAIFDEIPEGYTIYQLAVDEESTFANSIYPGDKIDLWMSTTENGYEIYSKFISNIEVLAVRDSSGNNVFDSQDGKSAWLLFAVDTEYYKYLKYAEFINGIDIEPALINNFNQTVGSQQVANSQLISLIMAQATCLEGCNEWFS